MKILNLSGCPSNEICRKLFMQLFIFCLAIIAPWFWFESHDKNLKNQFFLISRPKIQGWQFVPVGLSEQAKKSLGATDLFNGHFINSKSNRISVFSANWTAGNGDFNSLGHTPENCWVSTGFQIVPDSGPDNLAISIGGRGIQFQCRVLKHPEMVAPEIALWAACVDGRWDGIPYEPRQAHTETSFNFFANFLNLMESHKNRWAFFRAHILIRSNPSAQKQFIRISTPLTTDWQTALGELTAFASQWLYLE